MTKKKSAKSIGIALIGAGMIAQRHVTAMSAIQARARLVSIVSRRPERARYLAEFYAGPTPLFTSDIAMIVEDAGIQVVVVATPPDVRIDLIEMLAASGKHILLEKPVARNLDEAVQVVEICERAGVHLGVLFQHRVRASSLAATLALRDGAIGKPGHVEIAVPLWRDQSYYDELDRGSYARDGGGVLITQAIHTIDLALSLTGPVTRVQAMTATTPLHKMESEDLAVAGLHFASGAVGSLVASTATFPHGSETITLHCENGTMRISPEMLQIFWRDGRVECQPRSEVGGHDEKDKTEKHVWHQCVIENFLDTVQLGYGTLVTGREALASHRLIDAIEASARGGKVIDMLDGSLGRAID